MSQHILYELSLFDINERCPRHQHLYLSSLSQVKTPQVKCITDFKTVHVPHAIPLVRLIGRFLFSRPDLQQTLAAITASSLDVRG